MSEKQKCFFTTNNITHTLECSPDGNFDSLGYPVKICKLFPCRKFRALWGYEKEWNKQNREDLWDNKGCKITRVYADVNRKINNAIHRK